MEKLFLALIFFIVSVNSLAQSSGANVVIKGVVVDSLETALPYVTIQVREPGKKEALKSTYTRPDGAFEVTGLAATPLELILKSVGYQSRTLPLAASAPGSPVIDLGHLRLSPAVRQLKAVTVTAQQLLVRQEIDKIVYEVEADPESRHAMALDIFRKVPLLTVDADDNVLLKGTGNFRVLVNGRSSSAFTRNARDVLRSMPASTIKSVEVITQPPARYEAEGIGGIINIITVRKNTDGYKGAVNLAARAPAGYNAGGYATGKAGKLGASLYAGNNYYQSPSTANNVFRSDYAAQTRLVQQGENDNYGNFSFLDLTLSYEPDSLHLITGNYSLNAGNNATDLVQTVAVAAGADALQRQNARFNAGTFGWRAGDVGLDYQQGFRRNKAQLFTLSYKYNNSTNDNHSDFRIEYNDWLARQYTTTNQGRAREHTLQADYVHPVGRHTLEVGAKTMWRRNGSDYFYAAPAPGTDEYVVDPAYSNRFDYDQDIVAGYASWGLNQGDWGLKVGIRGEQTWVQGRLASSAPVVEQRYANLMPSVALLRKLDGEKTARLSYSRRIERPGLVYLDPYVNRIDPRNEFTGNPALHAATSNAFELSYNTAVKKASVNVNLSYQFTNGAIQPFTILRADSVSRTSYANLGRSESFGVFLTTQLAATKNLNVNFNASASLTSLGGMIPGVGGDLTPARNRGLTGTLFTNFSYKFKKKWRAGGNFSYNSPQVLLQGTTAGYVFNSFSLSRTLFKKDKGSISLSVSSPFQRSRRLANNIRDVWFEQTAESFKYMRRLNLFFNYRFGQLKGDIARKKRGIKNDDVQGGNLGGDAGN